MLRPRARAEARKLGPERVDGRSFKAADTAGAAARGGTFPPLRTQGPSEEKPLPSALPPAAGDAGRCGIHRPHRRLPKAPPWATGDGMQGTLRRRPVGRPLSTREADRLGTHCGRGQARFPGGESSRSPGSLAPLSTRVSAAAFGFSQNPQKCSGLPGLGGAGRPRSRPRSRRPEAELWFEPGAAGAIPGPVRSVGLGEGRGLRLSWGQGC